MQQQTAPTHRRTRGNRYLVVANPASGFSRAASLIKAAEGSSGPEFSVWPLTTLNDAEFRETALTSRAVVAVGGDGTASAVARALRGTEVPIGIVPCGTGNDLAREVGTYGPLARCRTLEEALALFEQCTVRRLQCWEITEGIAREPLFFVNYCSFGADAAVVQRFARWRDRVRLLQRVFGTAANRMLYGLCGVHELRSRSRFTVGIEGRSGVRRDVDVLVLLIANIRHYLGGRISNCVSDYADDLSEAVPFGSLTEYLRLFLPGRQPDRESVLSFPAITISGLRRGVPLQVDGEPAGVTSGGEVKIVPAGEVQVLGKFAETM